MTALGSFLRAARLRYGHSKRHRAFIRMTPAGPGRTAIEMVPDTELVPSPRGVNPSPEKHYVWWDDKAEAERILDSLVCLRGVRPKRRLEFHVDDDGRHVP